MATKAELDSLKRLASGENVLTAADLQLFKKYNIQHTENTNYAVIHIGGFLGCGISDSELQNLKTRLSTLNIHLIIIRKWQQTETN